MYILLEETCKDVSFQGNGDVRLEISFVQANLYWN